MADTVAEIPVGGPAPYVVAVGSGLADRITSAVEGVARVALIHGPHPADAIVRLRQALGAAGHQVTPIAVADGESGKRLVVAQQCWDRLARDGFTRSDIVIGCGGGAVTDLAGFVAATWLRGVRLVNVPTTVLGMVDAAVGGKTAINLVAGKNLVGAFHPPVAVIADLQLLATLPDPEFRSGLAEVAKCGFIADPVILDLLTDDPGGRVAVQELLVRAIRVKAEIVSEDLTDLGRREVLNYGHTLGHAIEVCSDYRIRHGEAVSIGMVFAARLARHAGVLDRGTADQHGQLLASMGLPTAYGGPLAELLAPMRIDKKARGASLRFVILEAVARPRILEAPGQELIEAAYADLAPR